MKLRIRGNSLAFRLTRSELVKSSKDEDLEYRTGEISIRRCTTDIESLAETDRLGIYTEVDLGVRSTLALLIEKDFACLDQDESSGADQFPNPFGVFG